MMLSPLVKFDITWYPECLVDDDDGDDKDNVNDNEDASIAELWLFKLKSAILDELDCVTTTGTGGRRNIDEPL